MSSIYGFSPKGLGTGNPLGQNSQVVIPQITFPNSIQNFEPLTANGKEAAKNIHTPPGTRVPIFDTEESIFYYKETDKYGNVVSFETYAYEKVEEPAPPQYVTTDMFSELVDQVKSLREEISNGTQSIRRQDKQRPNKQWNGNRSAERADFTNKVADGNDAGE